MIKFYTGIKFVNQGDGVYFITPTDGTLAHIYIVAGQTVEKVAEINSINASDVNDIKDNLQKQITQNATDVATALAGLKAITDKHGATLEKLEKKVDDNTAAHEANATSITKIINGETPVAKATNADNATKATQDGDGNVITTTYATKDELNTHKDYVGTFTPYTNSQNKEIDTVIEYIDDKTTGIASDSEVKSLGNRVSKVEGYFDNNGNAKNALDADHADTADTATSADKTKGTLTIGEKTFNGSTDVSITVEDFGLDNAMHFLGTSSTAVTDGGSEQPTIGGSAVTPVAGDVVIWGEQEYIYNSLGKWEVFGNEGSYAFKTTKIEAGAGLTGGGDLSDNREIAHAVPTGAGTTNNVTEAAGTFISGITFDEFGHVVGIDTAEDIQYEADKGIEITADHTIQHTNAVQGGAGSAAGSNGNIGFGGSINIPKITYDAEGHITKAETTTVNLPSDDRITALENSLVWYSSVDGTKIV